MIQRYVLLSWRADRQDEQVLPEGTTEAEAIAVMDSAFSALSPRDRKAQRYEIAKLAVDDSGEIINEWDDGYKEAVAKGWDTPAGYTPIAVRPE